MSNEADLMAILQKGPPDGTKSWLRYCAANKEDEICQYIPGNYHYEMSLAANATFAALFGISFIGFLATYIVTRRGLYFSLAFMTGVLLEVLGYAGRIMGWINKWNGDGFLMQICCLTIAPAFLAGGVYLCLRRIVYAFGPENSRIKPETYTRFFIPCDVISLVLQAVGGAMASISSQNAQNENSSSYDKSGDHIMMAGLSFQVFTLLVFMACSIEFGLNVRRRYKQLGEAAFDQNEEVRAIRGSGMFKGMLGAIALATVCIFWRCVFRVAELSEGWNGPLMARQDLFIAFEGVMIIVACLALNVFHPSVCFGTLMDGPNRKAAPRPRHGKSEAPSDSDVHV